MMQPSQNDKFLSNIRPESYRLADDDNNLFQKHNEYSQRCGVDPKPSQPNYSNSLQHTDKILCDTMQTQPGSLTKFHVKDTGDNMGFQ